MVSTQGTAMHLLRPQPMVHGWFVILGALIGALSLGWYFLEPGLFLLQMPIFLGSILLGGIAWIGVLRYPPPWLPVAMIVFVFFMMDFTLRSSHVSPGGFDIQSVLKGIVWIVLLSFGVVNGIRKVLDDKLLSLFFAYTLFAFFSVFYSRAFFLGLGSSFALLGLACFSGVIGTWSKDTVNKMWQGIFVASAVMAVLSLVFYFVAPEMVIDNNTGPNRLRGLTGSGNSLGPIMSIGVLAGVYLWASCKKKVRILLALGIMLLLISLVWSQSRASMVALFAGFLLVAALSNVFAFIFSAAFACAGVWSLLQPGFLDSLLRGLASIVSRSGRVSEITSFTGRSDIWAGVMAKWLESPWFGYGLGSPRIVVSEAYADQWGNTHESAHNWLLESLISFGITGTSILVIFLALLAWRLWTFKKESAKPDSETLDWPLVLCMRRSFVFCLVSGLMEKAFAGMPNPTLILLTCMAGSCVVLARYQSRVPLAVGCFSAFPCTQLRTVTAGHNGA